MQTTAERRLASLLSVWRVSAIAPWLLAAVCAVGASPVVVSAQSLQFDGFVEPLNDVQVAALEMGNLQEVRVQVGDRVEAGDVIAVLDNALQTSAVEIARLQANMQGQFEAASAERDLHASRLEKLRRLEREGLARPDELARAEADLRIAEARLQTVEEERQLREAELQRYELQLSRRLIRAPISGTVAHLFHKAGEFVSPSEPAVVQLITTDPLLAVVNIPAEHAAEVSPGAIVHVQLATLSGGIDAAVQSVAPAIDGESGTVQIRILLPNPGGRLRAGDRCTVTFSGALVRTAADSANRSDRVVLGSGQ